MILQDKVVLVTGGTSGIGRATAIAYAQQQAKVVVVGRRMDEGEETVRLIKEAGGEAIFVQADVTKEADVEAMVDKAVGVFGRLDIAFNNAGTVAENPSLIEQTEAEYDRMMNVNVKGVWLSMKHEIAQMLKQGSGSFASGGTMCIVNTTSGVGVVASPSQLLYTASKHRVALARQLYQRHRTRYARRYRCGTEKKYDRMGAVVYGTAYQSRTGRHPKSSLTTNQL
ncbi:SDR family NAD(P)-dependent oxidoreductase [Gloeocapsopsis dulcis]|uniref:SDR family NAD(P)-dependent oxidoreductase n=1 Tax=Gloeocapsopsis dulcis TaxID=2859516 RepID=UPI0018C56FCB|nr:SDR family NAD(P)-dependent oxidoreductase [Gloeocapsopsis dulcis]WNN92198.1 SDR family NAD(P)-dependent oxidoreductase [Gloeocapsopsis dulcis]